MYHSNAMKKTKRKREPLGAHLKYLRSGLGMTQEDVAEIAKVARSNYVQFETGAKRPGLETLRRLAGALGSTVDGLIAEMRAAK